MESATPTKLKSGDWGATVKSTDVKVGETITITTKTGKSWTAEVAKVVWSGNGVSIVATKSGGSNYVPATRNSRGYVDQRGHMEGYCGYPCPVSGKTCCPKNGPCHDCL